MFPKLFDGSDNLLAILDNIIKDSAIIKRVVNGEFTFTFDAFEKELKSEYFTESNYISIDNQHFDIKYIEQVHDGDVLYNILCEHISYRMLDGASNEFENYAFTGTPESILTDILDGTEFTVGTVEPTDSITFTINNKITRKALITQLANIVNGEIEYTNNGFEINILNTIGQDNGFQVRFGKNLKAIKKIIDNRGELKTYYDIDLIALRNSNTYIKAELQDLEVIGVGDTIKIIDEVINLDIQNRIVSIEYNPIFQLNTKLEIANTIKLLTDKITQIETSSVIKEDVYNGVRIGPTDGYVAERSDKTAMIKMNATEGISIFRDTGSGYFKNFELDVDGNIIMTGNITLNGGSVNGVYIVDNTIVADKLSVSQLSAISADMGTITAGTINAINIYGANIDIDEDVAVGGKIKMTNDADAGTAEWGTFKVLAAGPSYVDALYLGRELTRVGAGYSVDYLPQFHAFCDSSTFYGSLKTSNHNISAVNGNLVASRGLVGPSTYDGGFLFMYNQNGDTTVQLGTDGDESYLPGLLVLFNGDTGTNEARAYLAVSNTDDRAFMYLKQGSNNGHSFVYDSSTNDAVYNMYDGSGVLGVQLVADGNSHMLGRLSVGNSNFLTNYSINTENGIRCPFLRIVEDTSYPPETADGVICVVSNKLYVRLAGVWEEVATV